MATLNKHEDIKRESIKNLCYILCTLKYVISFREIIFPLHLYKQFSCDKIAIFSVMLLTILKQYQFVHSKAILCI